MPKSVMPSELKMAKLLRRKKRKNLAVLA